MSKPGVWFGHVDTLKFPQKCTVCLRVFYSNYIGESTCGSCYRLVLGNCRDCGAHIIYHMEPGQLAGWPQCSMCRLKEAMGSDTLLVYLYCTFSLTGMCYEKS